MNTKRFKQITSYEKEGAITYIMMHSFRLHFNHGLYQAYNLSQKENKDFIILVYRHKEENTRQNLFFFDGISQYKGLLSKFTKHVYYAEEINNQVENIIRISETIYKDRSYLKEHRIIEQNMTDLSNKYQTNLILVESNVVVPILESSNKEEYSAKTIRPKIHKLLHDYIDIDDIKAPMFPFEAKARDILDNFITYKLNNYHLSNDPSLDYTSHLSAYLKYGFISPVEIFIKITESNKQNKDAYIEQLIVRRELAYNFVYYNEHYNDFKHITYEWAYHTMNVHLHDQREYLYKVDDYINFKTHDPYFNAAMKELVHFGTMHNYLRMYWAKKIIEWSPSYIEAYKITIYLNNYYLLDGNDPNGYTGVAWNYGKHDRAWTERPIFGKLRYMNQNGLKRKFNIDLYVEQINKRVGI
jgi:deoxyribodipyrimidine photo-lyase